MFTGIVREVGEVTATEPRLRVRTGLRPGIGGSVAVNGACLTVVDEDPGGGELEFDVVEETRRRTNLGSLAPGSRVNLEPAVTAATALDGHLVQGHVDGTAEIREASEHDLTIELPGSLARYVAEKGSIAVDGTSLTVARLHDDQRTFTVALIPHTLTHTIAATYRPGTRVNLEVDVVARYAERLIEARKT